MFPTLTPATKIFIFLFAGFFLLGLFLSNIIWGLMALSGPMVVPGMEIWRLVTYPFIVAGPWPLISVGMVLYFFGSELEAISKPNKFAYMLLGMIIVGGLIFALFIPNGILAGPEVVSIFIVTAFAYMWPRRELSVLGIFNVQAWIIAAVFFLLAIIPSTGTRLNTTWSKIFAPLYGAIAALVYFHFSYRQYAFGRAAIESFRRIFYRTPRPGSGLTSVDSLSTQQRVDAILDKIASRGINSLSKEEREFLDRHSRN
jgi:membrane associated rhomboid family serine protease